MLFFAERPYTIEYSPSVTVGNTGRFDLDGMVSLSLTRQLSNCILRFTAVVGHIGGRDDLFPSLPFVLRHFVNQCVSRFYGTVVKWAA